MMSGRLWCVIGGAVAGLLIASAPASAHSQSYGYLNVAIGESAVTGKLELAARDLDRVHDLDRDRDGNITWGEFRAREGEIASAMLQGIAIGATTGRCPLSALPALIDSHGGETYIVIPFSSDCDASAGAIDLDYRLQFGHDAQHRGLVSISTPKGNANFVATPQSQRISFTPGQAGWLAQSMSYVTHGMHHILTGYDHLLFLLTLLFGTAVLHSAQRMPKAFLETAKVVTAFTLSHSVTLALAALGILKVPTVIAESLIAATIALAAINNLWPILTRRLWLVALIFGLIHGVGFASVLADLGLPRDNLLASLLAFNIGVEIGQLAVVLLALPVIMLAVRPAVGRIAVPAANCAITLIALLWLSDRTLGTMMMPF